MQGGGGEENVEALFGKGKVVEVESDEEGFKGSRYVATVVDTNIDIAEEGESCGSSSTKKTKKSKNKIKRLVRVEYHTLVADEDRSEPLTEVVEVGFLRPQPPPDCGHSFDLHDVVDGFHRDGWWTGVITKLLPHSRFIVTFHNPPDELEFGLSELRLHFDWLHGQWVRPQKLLLPRTQGSVFGIGNKVEVSFDKEQPHHVWFPAILLEDFGNNSFLVECQSSAEAGVSKVTVDSLHIRPSPPHLKDITFVLLDKVDAFYDFGWWAGVITKELADSKYIVFFKPTKTQMEINHSEIRRHMEWINGKWIGDSQDVLHDANNTEMAVQLVNSSAAKDNYEERTPCSLDSREKEAENQITRLTPCNKKSSSSHAIATQKRKSKQKTPDSVASLPRPLKKLKDVTDTGTNISKDPLVGDQFCAKNESLCQQNKQPKFGDLDNINTPTPVRRKRSPTPVQRKRSVNSQIKSSQSSVEGNTGFVGAEEFVEKECITKDTDLPVIIGLECTGLRGSQARKSVHSSSEKTLKLFGDKNQQSNESTPKTKEINMLEEGGESMPKKRRGRPPKILAKSLEALVAGKEHNKDAVAIDEIVVKDCITSEVESAAITGVQSARTKGSLRGNEYLKLVGDDKKLPEGPVKQKDSKTKSSPAKKHKLSSEKVVQDSGGQREKSSSIRSKQRRAGLNIESPQQDPQEDVGGENAAEDFGTEMVQVETTMDNSPSSLEDQPIKMWFGRRHSPTVDGSRVFTARSAQNTEAKKTIQSPAVDADGDIVPHGSWSLPFARNSQLWGNIEAMEVFQVMPQKPHFQPLNSCKESSREGLAIGCMVTFAGVVEKTFNLHFDDPRSIIEDGLETLLDLESHGFDVKMVRDRLTGLLLLKDKQEQLQDQTTELKIRIVEDTNRNRKIDEDIDEVDRAIREMQERRALYVSMKESKDSEVASLQSRLKEMSEDIMCVKLDFEGLAATPWEVA